MPDHRTTPTRPRSPTLTPRSTTVLARWPQAIAAAILLGLFTCTIRVAVHEKDAAAVWVTIGFWVLVGAPAAHDIYDRSHGHLPPRRRSW